jgi:multidrug transporter EmrE-like cation transporter
MLKFAAPLLLLALPSAALATPSRTEAFSNNPAFTDDTDFLAYPSVLPDIGNNVWLSLSPTAMMGAVSWEGSTQQAMTITNMPMASDYPAGWSGVGAVGTSLGPVVLPTEDLAGAAKTPVIAAQGPWLASYTRASGGKGYALRTSWFASAFSVGGTYSTGEGGDEPSNLAVGGDLTSFGDLGDQVSLNAFLKKRTITEDKTTAWGAGLNFVQDGNVDLNGHFLMGPRFHGEDDAVEAALLIGPTLHLTKIQDVDAMPLQLSLPVVNLAVAYSLREWLAIRGSAVAGWVANTTSEDPSEITWDSGAGGMLGMGISQDHASFDFAVNPAWALAGPFALSGAAAPMFATVSARFDL